MLGKQDNQMGFEDSFIVNHRKIQNDFLENVSTLIDFSPIERNLAAMYSHTGRPGHDPILMFKILLLQHFYNLSDPQAELAIHDRLSFQKFLGLCIHDRIPDETSICRFRERLLKHKLQDKLLAIVNKQLEARSLIVRKATIIDATLVEAATARPSKEVHAQGKASDPDADYTIKSRHIHYGYKLHTAVDAEHQLIRRMCITPASCHDSERFETLLHGDEMAVFADKGYYHQTRKAQLRQNGIFCGIMNKRHRGQKALTTKQKEWNAKISGIRSSIERVFAHLKRWQHYTRVRYRGLPKNSLEMEFKAITYNLKRSVAIVCP